MRLFERALRRADVPVAMSEGFNPRPRISFPMALSVGLSGRSEVADVGLRDWLRPAELRRLLQPELPADIQILSVETTPLHPAREPREAAYRVPLLPGHCITLGSIEQFLAASRVVLNRARKDRVKEVEVRQFVKALRLEAGELHMLLLCTPVGTARPEEVMEALGCTEGRDYALGRIERTHVNLSPPR